MAEPAAKPRAVGSRSALLLDGVIELMSAEGGLDEIADSLADLVCSLTQADGSAVSRVEADAVAYIAAAGKLAGIEGRRNPRDGSLAGIAIATTSPQLSVDTATDTRVNREVCERFGIRSMAILPIREANYTLASVMIVASEPGGITAEDVEFLAPLIRAVAAKLARAAIDDARSTRLEMLEDVTGSSRAVLLAEDPGQYLVEAVARVADAPHVYLLMPSGPDALVVTKSIGHSLIGEVVANDDSTVTGTVFRSGRPRVITDWSKGASARPEVVAAILAAGGDISRSAAYIPLATSEGPVGVVAALMREPITATNASLLGLLGLLAAEAGVAIVRDSLRRTLADQARTDPLTGLANRRVWDERLEVEIARAKRGAPLAVGVLDVDFFKRYNDEHGHPAGDAFLREVSAAWVSAIRPGDLVARLGGEEFGILLPSTDLESAEVVGCRLGGAVPHGETVSIGLTMYVVGEGADELMQRADEGLYAAKAAGRNRTVSR
jgi:diguanylate cyclase (GGDEF)-like protein